MKFKNFIIFTLTFLIIGCDGSYQSNDEDMIYEIDPFLKSGGFVAEIVSPIFLSNTSPESVCPAKKIKSAIVLHSETDDIVPFEDTQELFRSSVDITVIACNDNHRMRKKETLEKIVECVKSFIVE